MEKTEQPTQQVQIEVGVAPAPRPPHVWPLLLSRTLVDPTKIRDGMKFVVVEMRPNEFELVEAPE